MKNSNLLALFIVFFLGPTLLTIMIFHSQGPHDLHDKIKLGTLSIASAKENFVLGVKKKNMPSNDNGGDENALKEPVVPVELVMPQEEIEWIRRRNQTWWNFYNTDREKRMRDKRWHAANSDTTRNEINQTTGFTQYTEDKEGPWFDFMIAGHPKTGTTTLVANLGKVAPMKVKDFCTTRPSTLLHYLFDAWPRKFPEILDEPDRYIPDRSLQLSGSKCPQFISSPELLSRYTLSHPRMKLIIGIRHPIEWFISFIRMGHHSNLYKLMELCPHFHNIDPISGIPGGISSDVSRHKPGFERCINECRCGIPICFHRSRLHLGLARMGKTPLSFTERELLAPGDPDGGENMFNAEVKNPVFLYDMTQMKSDSYWDELAAFLGLSYIPNVHYHGSKGQKGGSNVTLCTPYYDEFRSKIMEHSYNMSVWLEDYILPLGLDPDRPDVVIANTDTFRELIRSYKKDPCGRLVRNNADARYMLDPSLRVGGTENFEIHSTEINESCKADFPLTEEEEQSRKMKREARNQKNGPHTGEGKETRKQGREDKREKQMKREKRQERRREHGEVSSETHKRMVTEAIRQAEEARLKHEALSATQ